MYHPTTRVLAVLALLQAHGRLTGAQLAARLEVNIRTLRRYITMLQDLGIPIVAERGRSGSYELVPGHKLPPMMFTNEEAVALSLGLLLARQQGRAAADPAVTSAQAKLEQVLPFDLRQQVQSLVETVRLDDVRGAAPGVNLLTLSTAAHRQQGVYLQYESRDGALSTRTLDPYGLAFWQGSWYAVGYCHLRQAMRSFRLDRIQSAEVLPSSFIRPADFDALAYLTRSMVVIPRQYSFQVLLRTTLASAAQEGFPMLGLLEPHAEGVLLSGTVDDLDWLAHVLARFTFSFRVIAPASLRDALRKRAEALLRLAAD
jgi:predicted DNA-binding transcriptional regulator YafY